MFKRLKTTPKLETIITVALIASAVILIGAILLQSLNHIIGFAGYAANGAFQLMNPLARLGSGEILGRDFNFFHGAGVVLAHYPLYSLFGGDLFGSEMSRWLTSIILFITSTLFLCFAWFKSSKDKTSMVAISFTVILLLSMAFTETVTPSNSLLGVRSTMPIIIGSLLLLQNTITSKWILLRGRISIKLFDILIGVCLSLAILLGTEHGVASVIAYSLLQLGQSFIATSSKNKGALKRIGRTLLHLSINLAPVAAISLISLLAISSVISLGSPIDLLRYTLVTVPGDQFWYFGAEPQGYLDIKSLFVQLAHPSMAPLYIALLITTASLLTAKKYSLLTKTQWTATLFLILYGAATLSSFLGYYSPTGQIVGFMRVLVAVNSLVLIAGLYRFPVSSKIHNLRTPVTGISLALVCIFTAISIISPLEVRPLLKSTYKNARGDHSTLLGSAWTTWNDTFKPYIEGAKVTTDIPLWSTYASIYERDASLIQPSSGGYDYIIHALGNDGRKQYTKDFISMKPELVTTLKPSYFGFEEWLWGRHAEFYAHLVNNYSIVSQHEAHVLWKRNSAPEPAHKPKDLTIDHASKIIDLPESNSIDTQLIEVEVDYKTNAPLGLTHLPRYIIKPIKTTSTIGFSMPPNETSWKFLVVLKSGEQGSLNYYANGLVPWANLEVTKATYTPIITDSDERDFFTEESVFLKPSPQ